MALENVEVLSLLGFVTFGIVIFQSGFRAPGVQDPYPTYYFNDAWTKCLVLSGLTPKDVNFNNITIYMDSKQGMLECNESTIIGYHVYRERPNPDYWYDMEARRCDAEEWCKLTKGLPNITSSNFAWLCDHKNIGMIWPTHENEPCPPRLDYLTKEQATEKCPGGELLTLSKMWLCSNPVNFTINELAWIKDLAFFASI